MDGLEDANLLAPRFSAPYFAVVFTSVLAGEGTAEYAAWADELDRLGAEQPGFLGIDSVRDPVSRVGITVSYWRTAEDVRAWGGHARHRIAQKLGRDTFYERFVTRVAEVQREYDFDRSGRSGVAHGAPSPTGLPQ